jgi:hypothetical protein
VIRARDFDGERQEVPIVADDGSFHYFTPPLPNGELDYGDGANSGRWNTRQEKSSFNRDLIFITSDWQLGADCLSIQ